MAMNAEDRKWRSLGIGGSDARTIASGDAEAWRTLKAQKIDGIEPFFSKQQRFLMDMGTAVEPVVLEYIHLNVTPLVENPRKAVRMEADPYFRCTLDGVTCLGHPVQCKFHTGDKDLEALEEFYWPQLQHEMLVTGQKMLMFAVAFGHYGRFEHKMSEQDYGFQSNYMTRALQFKEFCWGNGQLPEDLRQGEPQAIATNIPRLRDHVWAEGDNQIAVAATSWLSNAEAATVFAEAAKVIKDMVPEDCRSAVWLRGGAGIKVTVNKAGSKSIKAHVGKLL